MIEQITGPGSSGIAENSGKPGKQATNGLFAKLMAMLGKHGKADEKTSPLTQGKAQNLTDLQRPTLLKQQTAGIQKVLLSGAGKEVTNTKETAKSIITATDGSTVQAVALQILAQQPNTKLKPAGFKFVAGEKTSSQEKSSTGKEAQAQPGTGKKSISQPGSAKGGLASAKSEHVQSVATKPELVQAAVTKPEPVQATTAKPELVQAAATRQEQVQATTAKPELVQTAAAKPELVQAAATRPELVQAATTRPEQVQATTAKPELVQAATTRPEQVQATTAKPELVVQAAATTKPELVQATTAKPELVVQAAATTKPELVQATAAKPELVQATTAKQEQVQATTAKPELVQATPAKPEPVQTTTNKRAAAFQPSDNNVKSPSATTEPLMAKQNQPSTAKPLANKTDTAIQEKSVGGTKAEIASPAAGRTTQAAQVTPPVSAQQSLAPEQIKEMPAAVHNALTEKNAERVRAAEKGINKTIQQHNEAKQRAAAERTSPFAVPNLAAQVNGPSTVSQNNVTTTVVPPLSQEAAQEDAGQQSSGKGSQDAHGFQVITTDSKSASVTGSNFKQYLSHAPTPTMTMFDSIQHIAQSAKNGQTRLEIQLDPANLGKIRISLQTDANNQLQVHMMVDQSSTRAAIDQQLPALRHALAQQGLDLSGFSMGSHGEQAASGSGGRHSASGTQQSDNEMTSNTLTETIRQTASRNDSGLSIHI
ncbi:MAG: hypothetical protein CO188_09860 [Zetaproteobacteria bacterium CG_4_9_14_3_um_filter_54_145]|nr:MAG: hypothetical protein COZ50_12815 [Zetaproteobacteria bacterium CG_4_10_14_3_um_filter_54_28]PJA28329.1 MAG: hypothetical protein CO188_09860 [Zetaproteobacteria bacterium CG_4_9_14_3_um_filter_54_145]